MDTFENEKMLMDLSKIMKGHVVVIETEGWFSSVTACIHAPGDLKLFIPKRSFIHTRVFS